MFFFPTFFVHGLLQIYSTRNIMSAASKKRRTPSPKKLSRPKLSLVPTNNNTASNSNGNSVGNGGWSFGPSVLPAPTTFTNPLCSYHQTGKNNARQLVYRCLT